MIIYLSNSNILIEEYQKEQKLTNLANAGSRKPETGSRKPEGNERKIAESKFAAFFSNMQIEFCSPKRVLGHRQ